MAIWAAAYDLPHLADPGKKIASLPILDYRWGKHADVFREEGAVKIPVGYGRLDDVHFVDPDDHSNDVGSVIHFFQRECLGSDDRPKVVGSFVTERRPDDLKSRATSVTDISGRGLTSYFLDRMKLLPFDYPSNPTSQGNWSFGGENLLGNPGFEASSFRPEVNEIHFDETVTGGSFDLTFGGDTTTIAFGASANAVEVALETDIAAIDDILVTGSGIFGDPYIIEAVNPAVLDGGLIFDGSALTPGPGITELYRTQFGALQPTSWTKSQNISVGVANVFGIYDSFLVTTDQAHSGTYSLRINPGALIGQVGRWAGAQQVVSVQPNGLYQASLWIRPTSASDKFRFIIRGIDEDWVAGDLGGTSFTANTWTEWVISDIDVGNRTEVIFRVANVNNIAAGDPADPSIFYVDDGEFYPGLPPANLGTIWDLILDTALSFIVPTFTDTLDSNGNAWDTERSITLTEGDSWGQIAEALQKLWGYIHRIRFDSEDNLYYFDIFNPGYIAVDHSTTDSGSLVVGMNILEGETVSRSPDATSWHIKDDSGVWVEDEDATLLAAWGEGQMFLNADSVANTADLQAILDKAKLTTADQMVTFQAAMNDQGQVIPNRDIDIFHNVSVELGGRSSIPRGDRIVTSVVVSGKPGQAPNFQIYVNSDAFASTGAAALAEAVRRLLRKTHKTPEVAGTPFIGGGGKGGQFTIQISAADANEISIGKADRQCTGAIGVDGSTVMSAISEISTVGGEVHLSDGSFLSGDVKIVVPAGVTLTGRGRGTHIISAVVNDWAVEVRQGGIARGFDVTNPNGHGVRLANPC